MSDIFIIALIILLVLVLVFTSGECSNSPGLRENADLKAYHFGFPTSGSYNYGGGPLTGGWPNPWWPRSWWSPRTYNYTFYAGVPPYYEDPGMYDPLSVGPILGEYY